MSIRGIFASHSGIVGERVGDLATRVLMLGYAGTAPLLALSSGMSKEAAGDSSYSWTEDSHISGNAACTSTINSVATALIVDDTNIWTKNTVVVNQTTGEYIYIVSVDSDTTATIVRGVGGSTAASITSGDKLQSVGTAFGEGSGKPEPVTQKGESRTNYVQIFKNGWAITGTAKAVKYHTGSQLAYNRSQALGYHLEDLERSFIFGRPYLTQSGAQQLRMSGGIAYQIATYGGLVESATDGTTPGNMSMDGIFSFMRRVFDRNVKGLPNERIAYTGSAVVELIQRMARLDSQYNITQGETKYGIKVMTLEGFNGDLKLMTHPLFVENSVWGHELHVYHPGLIKKRVLRDTWEENFGQGSSNNNGVDAEEGFVAIETGWQTQAAETMGILKNIQVAVKSPGL